MILSVNNRNQERRTIADLVSMNSSEYKFHVYQKKNGLLTENVSSEYPLVLLSCYAIYRDS